jgi:plastocyanin
MTCTIVKPGEGMKKIKLITIMLIILSSVLLGCVGKPVGTPTPTATPTATATAMPTVVQTSPIPTPTPTPVRIPSVYKSFVDEYYGFKRVIETNYTPIVYQNLTLNVHIGDTMIWINDATSGEKLTIVSEQGLWDLNDTRAILRWDTKQFSYNFTQPGTYGFYIKEYPRFQHQKIIVNP